MITARTVTSALYPGIDSLRDTLRVTQNSPTDRIILRLLRQAQNELEEKYGYVIGTGTFTSIADVVEDVEYMLPRSPVDEITSSSIGYTVDIDAIYGLAYIKFNESGNVTLEFTTRSTSTLPAPIVEAIEAYVYDRFTNEPPYTVRMSSILNGTRLKRWTF